MILLEQPGSFIESEEMPVEPSSQDRLAIADKLILSSRSRYWVDHGFRKMISAEPPVWHWLDTRTLLASLSTDEQGLADYFEDLSYNLGSRSELTGRNQLFLSHLKAYLLPQKIKPFFTHLNSYVRMILLEEFKALRGTQFLKDLEQYITETLLSDCINMPIKENMEMPYLMKKIAQYLADETGANPIISSLEKCLASDHFLIVTDNLGYLMRSSGINPDYPEVLDNELSIAMFGKSDERYDDLDTALRSTYQGNFISFLHEAKLSIAAGYSIRALIEEAKSFMDYATETFTASPLTAKLNEYYAITLIPLLELLEEKRYIEPKFSEPRTPSNFERGVMEKIMQALIDHIEKPISPDNAYYGEVLLRNVLLEAEQLELKHASMPSRVREIWSDVFWKLIEQFRKSLALSESHTHELLLSISDSRKDDRGFSSIKESVYLLAKMLSDRLGGLVSTEYDLPARMQKSDELAEIKKSFANAKVEVVVLS